MSTPVGITTNARRSPSFMTEPMDRIFVGMGAAGATAEPTSSRCGTSTANSPTPAAPAALCHIHGYSHELHGRHEWPAADNNANSTARRRTSTLTEQVGAASNRSSRDNGLQRKGHLHQRYDILVTGGLDHDGNAYSSISSGASRTWNGTRSPFGPANNSTAWQNTPSPSLRFVQHVGDLAAAVNGNALQTFIRHSTRTARRQRSPRASATGSRRKSMLEESIILTTAYRTLQRYEGQPDVSSLRLLFGINANKTVKSLTLPPVKVGTADNVVVVLAVALASNCGGQDYCAVKADADRAASSERCGCTGVGTRFSVAVTAAG